MTMRSFLREIFWLLALYIKCTLVLHGTMTVLLSIPCMIVITIQAPEYSERFFAKLAWCPVIITFLVVVWTVPVSLISLIKHMFLAKKRGAPSFNTIQKHKFELDVSMEKVVELSVENLTSLPRFRVINSEPVSGSIELIHVGARFLGCDRITVNVRKKQQGPSEITVISRPGSWLQAFDCGRNYQNVQYIVRALSKSTSLTQS